MRPSICLAASSAVAAIALAGCDSGSAPQPRASAPTTPKSTVLHLTATPSGGSGVDNPPKGPSVGDQFFEKGKLLDVGGAAAGTFQLVTQLVAGTPKKGDEHQSITLHLADGDILTVGDMPARDTYTVTVIGGNGAYAGVSGTMTAHTAPHHTEDLTVTLRR